MITIRKPQDLAEYYLYSPTMQSSLILETMNRINREGKGAERPHVDLKAEADGLTVQAVDDLLRRKVQSHRLVFPFESAELDQAMLLVQNECEVIVKSKEKKGA